jgi:hypothetical protein
MTMTTLRFEAADLGGQLPEPGHYRGRVTSARYRESSGGNRMIQVVYALEENLAGPARIAEYFVLEGASPRGLAMARRQLLELLRACGHEPRVGEEVRLDDLVGAELELRLEHDHYRGQPRLRVAGHRWAGPRPADGVPF